MKTFSACFLSCSYCSVYLSLSSWEAFYELRHKDLIGSTLWDLVHVSDLSKVQRVLEHGKQALKYGMLYDECEIMSSEVEDTMGSVSLWHLVAFYDLPVSLYVFICVQVFRHANKCHTELDLNPYFLHQGIQI